MGKALRRPPPPLLLLLLPPLLLVLVGSALPPVPRISRPFPEVEQVVRRFSHKTASNYSVFLVDPASRMLYVGAKDAVFALPLEDISQRSRMISWNVLQSPRNSCKMKGKKEAECHNFVRILEFANSTHLFACGTFAFDPQCGFIKASDFHRVESPESGRGKCPFEPSQPSTAVMADGALYAATVNNFLGTEPLISRATGNPAEQIRTDASVAWLNDPEFVASAFLRESRDGEDDKIYFFFTETAREYDSFEKVRVARVARVCKGDLGGQKTLQKKWTTFLKTQLVCSDPETGTVFNILKDMVTLPSENWTATVFYGVFVAQRNEAAGSAVCAYSVESIQSAMNGHFKEFKRDCDKWTRVVLGEVPEPRPGACITNSMKLAGIESSLALPDRVLTFVRDHPLMDQPAHPLENRPVLVKPGTQYRRLAVHRVKDLSGQEHEVLYLGTEDGHLHKAVQMGAKASLTEDLTLFVQPQPVRSLHLHQNWLYVASDSEVTQISTSNCAKYGTCQECLLSRDPACGWSKELGVCRDHHGHPGLLQDLMASKVPALCSLEKEEAPPTMLEVPALLTARVVLPCRPRSAWSSCEWQRPSPDAALYVWRNDGLEFTVTEATLGEYTCRCAESGVNGMVASYSLVNGAWAGPKASLSAERSYSVLVGVFCFVLGVIVSSGCLLLHEWRRREHMRRELISRERNGLDLLPSTTTSCSHEPQTPSSPEDERHPLALAKKNGSLNGYPHLYINELDTEQARIYLTGVPLAKCDETSI
ncbi:semaphorin-4F [Eublepharis macularius]|uniref:Semaphorin-4F n=1 Tax=Eublepharis macularius TaxID=481883 RepID=A0AA97JYS0_EUBMA|nr:semaphorin-4F [Eublepharis macularius]